MKVKKILSAVTAAALVCTAGIFSAIPGSAAEDTAAAEDTTATGEKTEVVKDITSEVKLLASGSEISFKTGTQKGTEGDLQAYAEFAPNGSSTYTFEFSVSSKDTTASVALGTYANKTWSQQANDSVDIVDGKATVTFDTFKTVGDTLKFMVFYPGADAVTITSVKGDAAATTAVSDTNPTTTTTTVSGGTSKTISFTQKSEENSEGKLQAYAEFDPEGADSVTVDFSVKSTDTEATLALGTWIEATEKWLQSDDVLATVKDGKGTATIDVPKPTGDTVKLMFFWPLADYVTIDSISLNFGAASAVTTTTTTTTVTGVTEEIDFTAGTQVAEGTGEKQAYAEFDPNGAKIATVEFTVKGTGIKKTTSAFGSWNPDYGAEGTWIESDNIYSVPVNGKCTASWEIDKNVGDTVKFSVYYPTAESITIDKIILNWGNEGKPATTTTTTGLYDKVAEYTESGNSILIPLYGAKGVTVAYKVKTSDTNTSYAFGQNVNGKYKDAESQDVKIPKSKIVEADYTVPEGASKTVKFSVYYPDTEASYEIVQVLLRYDSEPVADPIETVTLGTMDRSIDFETAADDDGNVSIEFPVKNAESFTIVYTMDPLTDESTYYYGRAEKGTGDWFQIEGSVSVPWSGQAIVTEKVPTGDETMTANANRVKFAVTSPSEVKIKQVILHYKEGTDPDASTLLGDITLDKNLSTADIVLLQKYLLKQETIDLEQFELADVSEDNKLNVIDAALLKAMLTAAK